MLGVSNRKKSRLSIFNVFKARVEVEPEKKMTCVRSDDGGKYTSNEFDAFFCKHEGINKQSTVATLLDKESSRVDEFFFSIILITISRHPLVTIEKNSSFHYEH